MKLRTLWSARASRGSTPRLPPLPAPGDFTADRRLIGISALAAAVGAVAAVIAVALLRLIDLFTNLFYFQRASRSRSPPAAGTTLGALAVLVPVVGGLIIGLMARYGSERIRGHGIPEAMEAILIGRSRMQPKVAVLKPLSSAISIGSGGPFGAEGPIIMTGGAFGSLIAQALPPHGRRAQDAAGGRRRRRACRRRSARRWPPCCWPSSCCCSSGSRAA